MDPLKDLNSFEVPYVERGERGQQEADQSGFQLRLTELNLNELPPHHSDGSGAPDIGASGDVESFGMSRDDLGAQGASQMPFDPSVYSDQRGNPHIRFAADHAVWSPGGNFGPMDCWSDIDSSSTWPAHLDQEGHSWTDAGEILPDWPSASADPWERSVGASVLSRDPQPSFDHTSGLGRGLASIGAEWNEALESCEGGPTDLEGPVVRQPRLEQTLDAWACESGQAEGEDRQEAVRRILAWGEDGDVYARLDLSNLSLTTLPDAFPAGVKSLNVSQNELVHLPDQLPSGLRTLDASCNLLTSLPETLPEGLQSLSLGSNRLAALPETLPENLWTLTVTTNLLTSLPDALPVGLQDLDVRGNRLTSLPDALPSGLRSLAVGSNRLASLPETLPSDLEELEADDNRLATLPDTLPTELRLLFARDNLLISLPETLPPELQRLHVSGNRLTSLPERLPAALQMLEARHNRLTSLPETLLTALCSECMVYLENNPLPEQVLTNLAGDLNAPRYAGPRIFFSMHDEVVEDQERSLPEAVAEWIKDEPEVITAWHSFAEEAGAPEYAIFLGKLKKTVNYDNLDFRQAVADGLRQAAMRPKLREQYFQLAVDASETCQDRITLTWNGMQTARLNADVEDGAYDQRLGELIQQARVLFRLDALEPIARQKVASLRGVDELEVYLAYQVKLRDRLDLQLIAPDMRFYDVSFVTENDLAEAEMQVKSQEAAGFADYLATCWQPWDAVMRRIAPEEHVKMQDRLAEALDEEFRRRLDQRLADNGLTGYSDAELQLGAIIRDEIACEIRGALTRQILEEHALQL
ncbi:Putative E3 ubiquitin-protein ligase (nopM) [Bradyrhizobium sp. ORS 285]|uniref:NEL-type E3 ubiquitin ligase domain-containing protein n=1 Tax=Bradyrhizobium sp. ORS 285 TaxID=115808 RepID=UPI00024084EE|nr:NEL-type E3 ubiquitin ligase domain-containing protein [Bradyrhizobium sp. ORS 285]CCD89724.1 conserved hypothetical protein (Leucine-rich repeat protein) [Bradyrhizobium sp. ORS 285]SMX56501.1 Putative E3 ubiquitin-protein ligase (nopM) [Bradyrhizobium sp. ORS 285]